MKKLLTITMLIVPLLAFSQRWSYVSEDTFEIPDHVAFWGNTTFFIVADTSLEDQPLTIIPPAGFTIMDSTEWVVDFGDKGTVIAMSLDTFGTSVSIDYITPIRNGKISERESYYDIASTGTMDISVSSTEKFFVSGTTTINLMSSTNRKKGDEVTLVFAASLTVTNSAVSSGVNFPFALAGAANFSATADDVLTVIWDGSSKFIEKSRSVN